MSDQGCIHIRIPQRQIHFFIAIIPYHLTMATTIAVVAAGAMGSAVARRLVQKGCTVLTNLSGRSEATRKRALDVGMIDASYSSISERASYVLSILPPSDALLFATKFAEASLKSNSELLFVDCNAVNPVTVKKISAIFAGSQIGFVDAGIIGGPPGDDYDPVFYASADDPNLLRKFDELSEFGLKISLLEGDGAGIGDASALKMSYAGITKGTIGLLTTMVLAAHASSPATAKALMAELYSSQPILLNRVVKTVPSMIPKAYRWVGEMEEIADFVGEGEGEIYKGMAKLYSRVDASLKEDQVDIQVLKDFVDEAKKLT